MLNKYVKNPQHLINVEGNIISTTQIYSSIIIFIILIYWVFYGFTFLRENSIKAFKGIVIFLINVAH